MTKISRTKSARLSWFTGNKTSREIERGTWKSEIQSERKKTRNCSSPANQRSDQILAAFLNLRAAPHFSFKVKFNRHPAPEVRYSNISNVIAVFVDFHLFKTHITHHVKKGKVLCLIFLRFYSWPRTRPISRTCPCRTISFLQSHYWHIFNIQYPLPSIYINSVKITTRQPQFLYKLTLGSELLLYC